MYERAAILASLALKKEVSEKYFCATLGWSPAAFQLVKYATWGGAPFQFPFREKTLKLKNGRGPLSTGVGNYGWWIFNISRF